MRAALVLICTIAGMSEATVAQDDIGAAARGAACATIDDSLARLVCFDKAFPRSYSSPAAAAPPNDAKADDFATAPAAVEEPGQDWSVDLSKSSMDDSPVVFALLLPEKVSGSGIGSADMALILRCSENTTSVILNTSMFMTEDNVPVTIRIGDGAAKKSSWALSTTNKSVGLWSGGQAIPFIKSLPDNTRLVVRIEERNRIDAEFQLGEVGKAAAQVADACHWPLAKTETPTAQTNQPLEIGAQ